MAQDRGKEMDLTAAGACWKVGKQEIAEHLRMSVKKLEEYMASKHFPGKKVGRAYMVHVEELDAWFRRVLRSPGGEDIED